MNKHPSRLAAAAFLGLFIAAPAGGQTGGGADEGNPLVRALNACRQVSESAARLACYDAASARLAEAVEKKEVVVVDKQAVKQTRRSLFGFSLPRVGIFAGDGEEEAEEIEATITAAGDLGHGKYQIRLDSGAMWQTLEARTNLGRPRAGQKITIKKGALGNYFLRIDGQRGVRGRRIG